MGGRRLFIPLFANSGLNPVLQRFQQKPFLQLVRDGKRQEMREREREREREQA